MGLYLYLFVIAFVNWAKFRKKPKGDGSTGGFRPSLNYMNSLTENWGNGPLAGIELAYASVTDNADSAADQRYLQRFGRDSGEICSITMYPTAGPSCSSTQCDGTNDRCCPGGPDPSDGTISATGDPSQWQNAPP